MGYGEMWRSMRKAGIANALLNGCSITLATATRNGEWR